MEARQVGHEPFARASDVRLGLAPFAGSPKLPQQVVVSVDERRAAQELDEAIEDHGALAVTENTLPAGLIIIVQLQNPARTYLNTSLVRP